MDKTMDGWSRKLFYLGIAVLMALGLLLAPATTIPQASAAGVDSEWQKVATPNMDDWFVAPGFNAYDYAVDDEDSVIYVVGDLWMDNDSDGNIDKYDEENPRLLKSEDGGATWTDKSKAIRDYLANTPYWSYSQVAVAPDNPDFVAVSVWNTTYNGYDYERRVLYSYDGGKKFRDTGPLVNISSGYYPIPVDISVSPLYGDNVRNIALIGCSNQFGGDGVVERHIFEGEKASGSWIDATNPSARAFNWSYCNIVTSVAWSPNFERDNTILVVTYYNSNGTTWLQHGSWSSDADEDILWNENASTYVKQGGSRVTPEDWYCSFWPAVQWKYTTGIALPSDYDGTSRNSMRCLVYVDCDNTAGNSTIFSMDEQYGNAPAFQIKKQIPPHGASASDPAYLASLAYSGTIAEGKAVAGVWGSGLPDGDFDTVYPTQGVQVYRNGALIDMDTEARWIAANDYKLPSGIGPAVVSYATAAGDKLYCLTPGIPCWWWMWSDDEFFYFDEGALSVSFNDGESFNQIGLINTDIGYLTDVAVAPDCNTTLVASIIHYGTNAYGYCNSTWLLCEALPEYASEYNGDWMRVWYGNFTNYGLLRLAPEETTEISNVYLSDWESTTLFYTESKGLDEWNRDTKSPFDIADLAVKAADSVYAVSADGKVAMFDGSRWPSANRKVDSTLKEGNTIAVLGDNVLVGGKSGDVAYSSDGGLIFGELEDGLPEDGDVFVAFDSYFDTNKVVYAAVAGGDVYRWTIDESDEWKELHASDVFGTGATVTYTGIVLERAGNPMTSATTGGVLYAAYCNYNGTAYTYQSGVLRCLNPAKEVCCGAADWDNVDEGLIRNETFDIEPTSLKICGCLSPDTNSKLFAIDAYTPYYNMTVLEDMNDVTGQKTYDSNMGRLWKFQDCFAKAAPVMTAPEDKAVIDSDPCNCWNDAFTLKWDRQCDACEYNVQISLDEDFTELVEPAILYTGQEWGTDEPIKPEEGTTPSVVILNKGLGDGSCGTTYYWRVRAAKSETGQVIRSPWSDARTFTIGAGPEAKVKLTSPSNGAIVPPTNVQFTWDAVPDATGYVFSLTNPVAGTDVVAATNVAGTTYTYIGTLSYDTPYLWTVKAMKGEVVFGEATATFTTASAPVVPEKPTTPAYVWVIIAIGAVLVIVTLVLIFRTRRV